jgi:inner membrane protein
VFQADLKLDAAFDLSGVPAAAPQGAELDWSHAQIVVGVSDARGALADATLTTDSKTVTLTPAEVAEDITIGGDQKRHIELSLFGANVGDIANWWQLLSDAPMCQSGRPLKRRCRICRWRS